MLTRCFALAIAITSTTTAYGGTMQEAYEKLWLKRAIDVNSADSVLQKPKAACVCQDGFNPGSLGALLKINTFASCGIPTFDGAGGVDFWDTCDTFEFIGK